MTKRTKQSRASPPASVPITAADVWRFKNSEAAQASNGLVGPVISDTLDNCAAVLSFVSEFHCRVPATELAEESETGLTYIVDYVLDAIEKQSKELEVKP
jgi:hypothetical protein